MELKQFKMMEVTGFTKEEAFAKAPFTIMGNATTAFQRWKEEQPVLTRTRLKLFLIDYLEQKTKNTCGLGFSITLEPNLYVPRKYPYEFINHKSKKLRRKYKHFYELVDANTDKILFCTDEGKKEVLKYAKRMFTDDGYKGNLYCRSVMLLVNKDPIAFELNYAPSERAKEGTFLVFGIEKPQQA